MATLVGEIGKFDPELKEWLQYVERLGFYFEANNITTQEKKRASFFSEIGPSPFALLRSLVAPAKLADKTYEEHRLQRSPNCRDGPGFHSHGPRSLRPFI